MYGAFESVSAYFDSSLSIATGEPLELNFYVRIFFFPSYHIYGIKHGVFKVYLWSEYVFDLFMKIVQDRKHWLFDYFQRAYMLPYKLVL